MEDAEKALAQGSVKGEHGKGKGSRNWTRADWL